MYEISRILLMIATIAGVYCIGAIAELSWPGSSIFVVVLVVIAALRKKRGALTTLGSAHWASEDDLRHAGMLDATSGLILGRLVGGRTDGRGVIQQLFALRVGAKEACQQLWMSSRRKSRQLVRLKGAVHTAIFGPSGSGKGASLIVPWLRNNMQSAVSVDLKGENAKLTASHRKRKFGHRIVHLDPWKVVTQKPDSYNALDFIDKNSPTAIDECNDLAKALVVRGPDEKEPHWNDSAEAMISAVLATIVWYGEPGTRSLQTARDILSDPQKLDVAIQLMCESDCWGGMLARMGSQLKYFTEKERNSVMTTVGRHLRFLDSLAVAESTRTSSFDPALLRHGKMTVYLILPPEHMRAQSALLRVWISSMLRAVVKQGLQRTDEVHFILDEAASLGRMECIDDAIDKYRG
jgi:type IV secretion system protein VirD4